MKILHWDEMFHPTFGYQINLLAKLQARQGHEVIILTSEKIEAHPTFKSFGNNDDICLEDKKYSDKYNVKIVRLPIHSVISGRVIYKKGYIEKIINFYPDVIMCHTNDTLSAMRIAQKYKKINKPIVFDNHMLVMASRNPLRNVFRLYFKTFITPIIKKNKWIVIKTQNDDYVNKHLGIPEEQTPFISFGSDTTIFYPDEKLKRENRKKYGIKNDDFVVIYTGKLSKDKGGLFLANTIKEKISDNKNVVFVIVGNANDDYGKEVERVFKESKNKIVRFPTQKYVDLPIFYQISDLSIFPKQASLSFFDAQACGLPVVSENNNINIDRLSFNNGFYFIEDDIESFREKIKKCVEMPNEEYMKMKDNSLRYIKEKYDYEHIAEKYTNILELELKRFVDGR